MSGGLEEGPRVLEEVERMVVDSDSLFGDNRIMGWELANKAG